MTTNVDAGELAKFDKLAARWWDPAGESRPLHELNPVRLKYVADRVALKDARVLDVGCGGGLLSEALAASGARVVGIDLASEVIDVAKLHLHETNLVVDYRLVSAEALAADHAESFDAITCMEMLEHVPDPRSILAACATMLKPGGKLFLSTINRTPKAFALAVVGAEYVLGLLPKGTHDYRRFIKPSELASWLRGAGFVLDDVQGLSYDPLLRRASLVRDTGVNYIACATKPA